MKIRKRDAGAAATGKEGGKPSRDDRGILPDGPKRYCRRCLLRDMGQEEYFQNLRAYIKNLDPDLKVDAPVYEERLSRCRECDQLLSGMCRICGCYVELRAAMKKNGCPRVHPLWEPDA